jgi:hypothetical protein
LALSSWQVTQSSFTLAWVRTTLPSFAGAWHISQLLSAKGGCMKRAISLGAAEVCGSWHSTQLADPNGWF